MQATAIVVNARPSATALEATRTALAALARGVTTPRPAQTLAQVSVERPRPATLVVTVDFSRN